MQTIDLLLSGSDGGLTAMTSINMMILGSGLMFLLFDDGVGVGLQCIGHYIGQICHSL